MTNFSKNKKDKKNKRMKFNLKIFNQILFVLIIILGIYYVVGTNDLTVKGFKLQEFKVNLMEVGDENNNLELQMMSLGSYNNLSERIKKLDMVAVGHIEYISGVASAIAIKR
jgi:cell division protein FtsL